MLDTEKKIEKAAEYGKKKLSTRRDLDSADMIYLMTEAQGSSDALFCALVKAFRAGACAGYRQAQADAKKRNN